ncbi:hypothetical protein POTOM_011419 [Populus tomentosa]|uniref:Uncharacterized protein n=1 Tax=Populus tomentosa TaxID=118781 RepID=A0A8X8D8V0_POPTO|nr:hypothetical protein POTOM_011419 [Populus tomentosa]
MGPPLVDSIFNLENHMWFNFTEEVMEFTTKNMHYGYKGKILSYMSGIDLSNNNFRGAIPLEFGNLSEILSLNLSHNNLTGSIPATFSNLKHIESLDVSYNNLNGAIPPQLTGITTLEVFSVAHNNLSGRTPERKYQFGTFDESSYEGNHFLCGPPLRNNCSEEAVLSQPVPDDEQGDDGFIDMEFFYISFGVCYTVVVMTIAAVLYINPYWRRSSILNESQMHLLLHDQESKLGKRVSWELTGSNEKLGMVADCLSLAYEAACRAEDLPAACRNQTKAPFKKI